MLISQFSNDVDELLRDIEKLYQKRFSADFNEFDHAKEAALLQQYFNDIKPVVTKDPDGNAITDDDGKKLYTATDLLDLDRKEHIQEIAKQKLLLLEKLVSPNLNEQALQEIRNNYQNLQAKEEFFSGKGEDLAKRLDAAQADTANAPLVYGPLNKNAYSEQYEELVKGMVRGQKFTLDKNPDTNEYLVKMDGQEYQLNNILKHANLTHLTFNQQDCDNYLTMLATQPMAYKPDVDQSDAAGLAIARGKINADRNLTAEEKKRQINTLIDNVLLKNIEKQNNEKPAEKRDNSLAEISSAERLAINIWTTGFFDCANPFLRGDIEGTFERTRAMSDLVGGYKLCLSSELPATGPESGKLYLSKNDEGQLIYTVRTPQNMIEQNQVLTIKGLTLPPGDLSIAELEKHKDKILAESTKRGHTAVKENGRENAIRELLCTTAFVVHGASHVSKEAPVAEQTLYRGDDNLFKPVLDQRLKAAQMQESISLNAITSTAKDNPNVDFAFNSKSENAANVKVGSIHSAIGKDISAISAYKRENEFLSVSRHKQYEAALKTGENEYLFKVKDVTALNNLAPEELLTKNEMAKFEKRAKELNKKEKGILPTISRTKRNQIQVKKDENALKKSELIEDKRLYLADLAKPNQNDQKENAAPSETASHPAQAPRKRKRSESIEDKMINAEKYLAKKMKQMKDLIIPPTEVAHHPVHIPTEHAEKPKHEEPSSNPLMLPSAQLNHLRDLENELNQQPTLTNSSGGIEHLLIRQFQIDSAKETTQSKPPTPVASVAEDKKEDHHHKLR
jgi:hypothetical protein